MAAVLDHVLRTREPISTRHRIIDTTGATRDVIVLGELLKWRSQETNTKLRALAVQLVEDFLGLEYDEKLPARSALDRLFMTAHLRVADAQVRRLDDVGRPGS